MVNDHPKVLIVDAHPENLLILKKPMEALPVEVICATSGDKALALTRQYEFALCIIDVMMPEINGFANAQLILQNEEAKFVPIIFITAMDYDENHVFKGYDVGAVDYLCKPINVHILLHKVSFFLKLHHQRLKLLEAKEVLKKQKETLEKLASHDDLTGLLNRRSLNITLGKEFSRCQRYHSDLSLLMIDLDHFKEINDTYGHSFGDFVLTSFASRLTDTLREADFAFRFGGEEFILLLPQTDIKGAITLADRICEQNTREDFEFSNQKAQVTVSIGASSFDKYQPKIKDDLIALADKALYRATENGRNRTEIVEVNV
jgi:diguanylate cyclase (GGDEF)-like protein